MDSNFTKIARILLGLALILFGINKFYSFIPMPQPPQDAAEFLGSLAETGYFMTFVAVLEIIIGLMLLFKLWVPFALLLLLPISINIVLFHLFLDLPSISAGLILAILNVVLLYKHKQKYKPLFI
ncbi:hypothetical protein GCM10007424_28600 [Flavobacterium suaedae]|uniref:DoxX family membrane protein n=1 Tax=Flavobacterium suaedae TaxID=1767027 RepID=A0ABQ1K7E4_9FLAO|nr:DoxX family membrane protein [Flavobacterium suaedae]GGB86811.1 hypothetical protein GCM10007424_28600 [Flavobacterium suaedae]